VSRIYSPDNASLVEEENEDILIDQIHQQDPVKTKTAKLRRGIRTLREIAHFVRCFNNITEMKAKVDDDVWISPNAMLEMR
jgi:hypothetical protein